MIRLDLVVRLQLSCILQATMASWLLTQANGLNISIPYYSGTIPNLKFFTMFPSNRKTLSFSSPD